MIKESSLDKVRDANIYDIISHYAELKRSGSSWTCCSPLTNEKTPSFHVNTVKNNWVCYSSDQAGDGIKFVQLKENCSFIEAIEKIAAICHIILEHEAITEERQRVIDARQKGLQILKSASDIYQKKYNELTDNHWAKKLIESRGITKESILNFSIGYTPGSRIITDPLISKALFDEGKATGLITTKEDKHFDFFNDKIIFPIQDHRGDVIGFGGRADEGINPKYINTRETNYYSKTKVLYGLYQAKAAISRESTAILTEGYTDVIAAHQNELVNTVATCGTALTRAQAILLHKYARNVIILRDNDGVDEKGNDKAGIIAALKDINILLLQGFRVSVCLLPEGEDPDSYSRKGDLKKYIQEKSQDAVEWKTNKIKIKAANDPDAISDAVKEVSEMLFDIKDDIKRGLYIDKVAKLFKLPKKNFTDLLASIQEKIESKAAKVAELSNEQLDDLKLPKGADYQEFLKYGFVTVSNSYWFQSKNGFFKGSNFKMLPLFHIYGQKNNKRICEVMSEDKKRRLVVLETEDFLMMTKFQKRILDETFLVFTENVTNHHFIRMRNRILAEFTTAYEITTLGWQNKEKFFAFADCIYERGVLKRIDPYGIINIDKESKEDEEKSNYLDEVSSYYLPAFSELYKHMRDDDDPYENDRYFVYKQSPVTLQKWLDKLIEVYGLEKATIGFSFDVATLFRDVFLRRYGFFPLLFLSGTKGSGKTKFGESLVTLFTHKQEPFDLNSGTHVAFTRRIARLNNVPTMLEEYHDNIDEKLFQPLKGAYDGRGREMGKATGDNRTNTTKVNSSLILLSQYLSNRDDNSLTSRSIIINFIKSVDPFTFEQVEAYNALKSWEEAGLSSMLLDLLDHRVYIIDNLHKTYSDYTKRFKKDLKNMEYEERMLQNYAALITPLHLLSEKLHLPFNMELVYAQYKNAIIDSSDLIVESEGLAVFWEILEFLLHRGMIQNDYHFNVCTDFTVKLAGRKGEKDTEWKNAEGKRLLFLNLKAVHQLYHKEASTRDGSDIISASTMRNYFKAKGYFIGVKGSHRYGNKISTTAMVFDYDAMQKGGVLNLDSGITDHFKDLSPEM